MAVRDGMADLITRLRLLINDPAGGSQTWTDQELQDIYDEHRVEVRYQDLRAVDTRGSGGSATYKVFFADCGYWESSPTLANGSYETVTPGTPDLLTGRFEFADDQNGNLPIRITGYTYDVYGAAVAVIENWLAKLRTAVDFVTDDLEMKRSQQVKNLEVLLENYRQRAGQWTGAAAAQMAEDGLGTGRLLQTDFNAYSQC